MATAHNNIQSTLAAIRADHEHGASYLARQGAELLARIGADGHSSASVATQTVRRMRATCRDLIQARHSMAPLVTVASLVASSGRGKPPVVAITAMNQAARAIIDICDTAPNQIAARIAPLLGGQAHIVTLSRSATVAHCLSANHDHIAAITVLESRPGGEGITTARDLAQTAPGRVTLFPDAAMSLALDGATHVITGADAILADGTFANKTGTHALARLAHDRGVPVLVLAETLKVAPTSWRWQAEEFGDDLATDVTTLGFVARVPVFERAPLALVEMISERGILGAAEIAALAAEADKGFRGLRAKRTDK